MFVYFLLCSDNSTYIGATIDLDRRLRQHNKIIKGGATATGIKVDKGHTWKRVCYVSGFPNWNSTLQFEWRWKQISRKLDKKMIPLERRLLALNQLLSLEQSTSKAIPYSNWDDIPQIHIHQEVEICSIYLQSEVDNKYKIIIE
tara:strand:+ start:174 stop:605 length:432 start_codon:yes stop_codon:yes gene_type:complete